MGEDDAASRRFRPAEPREFFHQKRIRQPVKPVAPHALRFVATRDRQQLRDPGQVVVKSRVEAGDLGQVGSRAMKRLDQERSRPADVPDRTD